MSGNIEELLRQLASPDAERRTEAAERLMHLGEGAAPAAVALVRAADDEDERVREFATAALEELGPPDSAEVAALGAIAGEASSDGAYWAATLLGRLGGQASQAVADLADALSPSAAPHVRERTAWALGKIGPAAASALPALEAAAADGPPRLARLARTAIESIRTG